MEADEKQLPVFIPAAAQISNNRKKSSADAGTGRQVVTCCHPVDMFRQRRHFRTRLSLFSRNYPITLDRVLLKISKLDDIKAAAVDKKPL